ncbi:hypothetical protein [Natronorubrum halophilum]|uniref:hypothetical protein n=1 Tax=Natronorubrum halophilum TaxID=1702106 RepID=UPI0010C17395|nr:hypothetical protein [Natronorubrum halophilum]
MTPDPTRRRVLTLTGVGATASLAGCGQFDVSDGNSNGDSSDELEVGSEPDIDPEDGITAFVQPSRDELNAIEQEIMTEVENEELDRQEAQAELRERQGDLFTSYSVEFESKIADEDGISIEAGIGERGAFLLDGDDGRLLDTLRDGDADGLLPGEEYAAVLQEQEQPAPEPEPDDEPPEEGNDTESDDGDSASAANDTESESDDSESANDTDSESANDTDSSA